MKAICVDDEPLAVEYTLGQCARLSEIDDARGFTDAQQALDWLQGHPVDLALLDINMPKMNGIDALGEVMKIDPNAKVIMCSDQKYESMIMMALKKGAKDFVIKPFTSYDILLAVKKLFE